MRPAGESGQGPDPPAAEEHATRRCPPSVKLRVEDRYRALDNRAQMSVGSGLVHCDLSPDHVLIAADGTVRIVDWAFLSRGGTAR